MCNAGEPAIDGPSWAKVQLLEGVTASELGCIGLRSVQFVNSSVLYLANQVWYNLSMVYFVHGFRSGTFDNVGLGIAASKRKMSIFPNGECRTMEAYAVDSPGIFLLEARFGKGFEGFFLLNEVVIDACVLLGFDSGTQVGSIDIDELNGSAIRLFKAEFWT